jgi:hypothetical protein
MARKTTDVRRVPDPSSFFFGSLHRHGIGTNPTLVASEEG